MLLFQLIYISTEIEFNQTCMEPQQCTTLGQVDCIGDKCQCKLENHFVEAKCWEDRSTLPSVFKSLIKCQVANSSLSRSVGWRVHRQEGMPFRWWKIRQGWLPRRKMSVHGCLQTRRRQQQMQFRLSHCRQTFAAWLSMCKLCFRHEEHRCYSDHGCYPDICQNFIIFQ